MKLLSFILFLLVLSCNVTGQRLSRTLIIDTLGGQTEAFMVILQTSHGTVPDSSDKHAPRNFAKNGILLKRFPNVIATLNTDDTFAYVELTLDDSFGTLELRNFFMSKNDTVRISNFFVYRNCLPDTYKTGIGWYRVHRNAIDTNERFKTLSYITKEKIIEKGCKIDYPDSISYLISNKKYTVTLQRRSFASIVQQYSGHKKMGRRREKIYERKKDKGEPYTYFCGTSIGENSNLNAQVNIE